MNPILLRQNQEHNLRKLAAQRELYSKAKRVQAWQISAVLAASIFGVIAIWHEEIAGIVALFSIGVALTEFLSFEPAISKRKKQAAQIQESFDCGVLDIECSVFKASDPDIEEVLDNSEAVFKLQTDVEKLIDWYSDQIGSMESPTLGRFLCQRTNIMWDLELRRGYNALLVAPALVLVLITVLACFFRNIDFVHLVLVIASVLPAIVFFLKQRQQNMEAIDRLSGLSNHFREVWRKANENIMSELELAKAARQIQDEIYDHRAQSPLVVDFYYWLRRKKDQLIMHGAVKAHVSYQA